MRLKWALLAAGVSPIARDDAGAELRLPCRPKRPLDKLMGRYLRTSAEARGQSMRSQAGIGSEGTLDDASSPKTMNRSALQNDELG